MHSDRRIAALRQILATNALLNIGPSSSPNLSPQSSLQIPELQLKMPSPMSVSRHLNGVPPSAANQIQERIQQMLRDLQQVHLKTYQTTCTKLVSTRLTGNSSHMVHVLAQVRQTHENLWNQQAAALIDDRLPGLVTQRIQQANSNSSQEKKSPFNHEFTPLLEKYYEYNAFPSAKDRELLARQSMMEPRQIEVWFQNHRRRARKEGRPPKKLVMDQVPIELSFEQSMAPFMYDRSPSVDRLPTPPPEQTRGSATPVAMTSAPPAMPWRIEHSTILDTTDPPPHAFPATFADSSKLAVDPFPCKQGSFKFPTPVWAPKSIPRPRAPTCSITDLCNAFNTLRIYGPASPSSPSPEPWYASRCTGPLAAPHPSLIRPQPTLSPSTPAPSRRSPTPQTKSKKKRRPSTQGSRRLPSTLPSKSLSRMSSSSSLSSSSDIETPESSPAQSRATSLPLVYGVDDHAYMHASPPPLVFDIYAKHPPQNQHLQPPLWSMPHLLST